MKNYFYPVFSLALSAMLLQSCQNKTGADLGPDAFVIEGQLPADRYDSAKIYLVPMFGPHPRPVDSTIVAKDGSFRFEGNVEQMAVLRLDYRRRYGIQDLLVCTEPGVIHVTLDSISSSGGTPQNDLLQQWKERQQQYMHDTQMLAMMRKKGTPEQELTQFADSFRNEMGEFNYQLLKSTGRTTATIFINKMLSGHLDSLQRAELNEMLLDTVDYNLPQPGFHK